MKRSPDVYRRDVVAFIDDLIKVNERGKRFRLFDHQRKILRSAFAFDPDGCLPWKTIIYSCLKKSGKTTINAAVTLWWAFTQDPPNQILVLANDREQAEARVFKTIVGLLKQNPELKKSAKIQKGKILLSNGTEIMALASEAAGAAGSNHGLTSWDELWGYTSESATRFWEELTTVPTLTNSIRFITTYAGFENESELLLKLYKQGVGPEEHPDGQGTRLDQGLPIYANKSARIICYWDHEPRMPWQTPQYYAEQREILRPAQFLRLHENRWGTAETQFITAEMWDAIVDQDRRPLLSRQGSELYVGVDCATKHDCAAVVAVMRDGDRIALARHRIWKPTPQTPLDIESTVEAELRDLCRNHRVREIAVDPFQMARSIQTLGRDGLPIREFPQTVENCTRMGQTIFDLIRGRNLAVYPAADLREHALNTVVVESTRGWRIAKDKAAKKIDGIVALSMACVALGQRPASFPPLVFSYVVTPADRAKAYWARETRKTDPNGHHLVTTPSGKVEAYYDPRGLEPTAPAQPTKHDVNDAAHRTECRACRRAWRIA